MLEVIFEAVTYFMAVFGAITLFTMLIGSLQAYKVSKYSTIRMALIVKDAEEFIEGTVRDMIIRDIPGETKTDGILTVVDVGSTDRTVDILHKLKLEYGKLDVFTGEEAQKVFDIFS